MSNYLLVFLGGGLGSICRFGIGHIMTVYRFQFPWATFLANFLSCFVLGILVTLSFKGKLGGPASVLLMAGFCGGFSTFSTFTNEIFQMLMDGQWGKAGLYVLMSLVICTISLFTGMKLVS